MRQIYILKILVNTGIWVKLKFVQVILISILMELLQEGHGENH